MVTSHQGNAAQYGGSIRSIDPCRLKNSYSSLIMGHLSLFLFVTTLFRDKIDRFVPEKHLNNNTWDRNIIYSPKTISFVSEKRNLDRFRDKCPGSSQSTHFLRHAPVLRSDAPCPDRDRPSGLFHIFRKTPHMVTSVTISDENPIS